jgi:hypothetical protein
LRARFGAPVVTGKTEGRSASLFDRGELTVSAARLVNYRPQGVPVRMITPLGRPIVRANAGTVVVEREAPTPAREQRRNVEIRKDRMAGGQKTWGGGCRGGKPHRRRDVTGGGFSSGFFLWLGRRLGGSPVKPALGKIAKDDQRRQTDNQHPILELETGDGIIIEKKSRKPFQHAASL